MYEWDGETNLVWSQEDKSRFRSIRELAQDVRLHGYYGGIRLVKATIKKFAEYCIARGHRLHDRSYPSATGRHSPAQVGWPAPAIIAAAPLPDGFTASKSRWKSALARSLGRNGRTGNLPRRHQDRVIRSYEGSVYMDFAKDRDAAMPGADVRRLRASTRRLLPPLYIAYSTDVGKPTEVFPQQPPGEIPAPG